MAHRIATIARYTALEALRTRLPLLTAASIGILFAASFFVREIAITDSARFQTAFYAAAVRFAMVFLVALHAIASVSRDFQDKGLDSILALDVPRSHYVLGKLAGFIAIAGALAVASGVILVPLSGWEAAAQWTFSLALELALIVGVALFCVITLANVMPAASFVIAFYVFARALTAVRLIGANPVANADAPSHQAMRWLVEGLAYVVPPLDRWTRTDWLLGNDASWTSIAALAAHTALFVLIVTAAAVFDMHRRSF